ncbi:MAG: hypothetical protein FWC61_02185 [Proteobacteria bacterium]|nr:hypothetical protein [Pseudomonadota bacterium]
MNQNRLASLFALCPLLLALCCLPARAATTPPPTPRSVFSTSADWEAVTGLRLSEYRMTFGRDKTQGDIGLELYFLDGFPCYAQSERVRAWISPSFGYSVDKDAFMRIVCLAPPQTVQLAFRESRRTDFQGTTTGLLTCQTEKSGNDILVNLTNCQKLDNWKDFK